MSRQVHFSHLFCAQDILRCNKASEIVATYSNSSKLAIATNVGPPALVDLRSESFKTFIIPKNTKFESPISIAVDRKNNLVITGHTDGKISIFSVEDNYKLITTHKYLHKSPITAIGFSPKNDYFYIGDSSGLVTRIYFGGVIIKSLKEEFVYENKQSEVLKIDFSSEKYMYEFGIIVMTDSLYLINPINPCKEQITARFHFSNVKNYISVLFYERDGGIAEIYAFSNTWCHYFTITRYLDLNNHGSINIYKSDSEYTTNAMILNPKMIIVLNNYCIAQFVNAYYIRLSIERKYKNYYESVVQRRQSPLSQAIIAQSFNFITYDEQLYCCLHKDIIKMEYSPWKNVLNKFIKMKKWGKAILMIIEMSQYKELDIIGFPSQVSEQKLLLKELCKDIVTEYITSALDSKDENLIDRSFRDCIRLSSQFSIQKYVISEMLQKVEESGYLKLFFLSAFRKREGKSCDYITPDFVKLFVSKFKETDRNFIEKCMQLVDVPQSYSYDIAAILYETELIESFVNIMFFKIHDFITPCCLRSKYQTQYLQYLRYVFDDESINNQNKLKIVNYSPDNKEKTQSDNKAKAKSNNKKKAQNDNIKKTQSDDKFDPNQLTDLFQSYRAKTRKLTDSSNVRSNHENENDDENEYKINDQIIYDLEHKNDDNENKGAFISEHQHNSNDDGNQKPKDKIILEHVGLEEEKIQKLRIIAQRTLCIWLCCPAPILGYERFDELFDLKKNNLELATIIIKKCSTLLPLRYTPSDEITLTDFADIIMSLIEKIKLEGIDEKLENDEKYKIFYSILNIICPLYAIKNVKITKSALMLTTKWCFNCSEQPQSLRVKILQKIHSTYVKLFNDIDFKNYLRTAGFIFSEEYPLKNEFLEKKEYHMIVSAMLCDKEYRSSIFEFLSRVIEENKREVEKAIIENIEGLVLNDSDSLYDFVTEYCEPKFQTEIIEKINEIIIKKNNDLIKYLYYRSIIDHDINTERKYLIEYFHLLCKYNPNEAQIFYQEALTEDNMQDDIISPLKKYQIYDCLVMISKRQDKQDDAIKYIETGLVDLFESNYNFANSEKITEEQLSSYPIIIRLSNGIDALLDYQHEMFIKEPASEKLFKFLNVFNLPFYVSKEKGNQAATEALFILYSRFIIGSVQYIPIKILTQHFLNQTLLIGNINNKIMEILFNQVVTKNIFNQTVNQLLIEDTCYIVDQVSKRSTRGMRTAYNVCCSSCMKPLYPPEYGIVFLFPCGHIFHYELECVKTGYEEEEEEEANDEEVKKENEKEKVEKLRNVIKPKECPICSSGYVYVETLDVQLPRDLNIADNVLNRLLRKIDYSLRRNYGTDLDLYPPTSAFFALDKRYIGKDTFVPKKIKLANIIPINGIGDTM